MKTLTKAQVSFLIGLLFAILFIIFLNFGLGILGLISFGISYISFKYCMVISF